MSTQEKWGWWGISLPGRHTSATYSLFPYEEQPPIVISEEYKAITDLERLADFLQTIGERHDLKNSPTACYFEIDRASGAFFIDQQGCIIWCLDPSGKVITDDGTFVAHSLPEFLARIAMENSIEWNLNMYKLTPEQKTYINHFCTDL